MGEGSEKQMFQYEFLKRRKPKGNLKKYLHGYAQSLSLSLLHTRTDSRTHSHSYHTCSMIIFIMNSSTPRFFACVILINFLENCLVQRQLFALLRNLSNVFLLFHSCFTHVVFINMQIVSGIKTFSNNC